jgi:metal-sulfur cluster biosynthetic enzyme
VQPRPDSQAGPATARSDTEPRARILELLNSIVDPCSAASAVPAGLVDMGLIRSLSFEPLGPGRWCCQVKLCVTHAFCMMTGIFVNEIERRLGEHSQVGEVRVELDCSTIWTEDFMSQDYRARLRELRARRNIE